MNKYGHKVIALVDKNGKEYWSDITALKTGVEQILKQEKKINSLLQLFKEDGLQVHLQLIEELPQLLNFLTIIDEVSEGNKVNFIVE